MTRFVHLTDLHVSHPDAADAGRIPDTAGALRKAIEIVNAMDPQPDFVVASGDLPNLGAAPSYRLLAEILEQLQAPLIPGHVAGRIDDAGFAFLERALTRHETVAKLIVMHHPPRIDREGLPWASIDMASTERLAEMLAGKNIAGILSGHIHINLFSHWHGIPVVTNIGLNSSGDVLERRDLRIVEGTAMGLCDWRDSGLSVVFVPLSPAGQELGIIDRARLEAFR